MKKVVFVMTTILMVNCIEPFEFEVRSADNVLVVEAIMTDEIQKKQVILTRASDLNGVNLEEFDYNPLVPFKLPDDLTTYEENASVKIIDDLGNEWIFSEQSAGIYESNIAFGAKEERAYKLEIITAANETFESDFESILGKSEIKNVYAERVANENGEDGIAVFVDGIDNKNITDYFRYEYEETYTIVAPNWTAVEFDVVFEGNGISELPIIDIVPRAQEEQTCYGKANSSAILLANTLNLDRPQIERNQVRFVNRNNPILSHRYSILVKQYLQSQDSYSYFESLRNFSSSESIFSEIQPGFLEGNISSKNENDIVIGYFDVTSVAKERIFFNYVDFFEGEALPPYFFDFNCDRLLSPPLIKVQGCPVPLPVQVRLELIEYVDINATGEGCGPYLVTPRLCGDCTILGSNIKPEFWVD